MRSGRMRRTEVCGWWALGMGEGEELAGMTCGNTNSPGTTGTTTASIQGRFPACRHGRRTDGVRESEGRASGKGECRRTRASVLTAVTGRGDVKQGR